MLEPQRWIAPKKPLGPVKSYLKDKALRFTKQDLPSNKSGKTLKSVTKSSKPSKPKPAASKTYKSQLTLSRTYLDTQCATYIVNHNKAASSIRAAIIRGAGCTDPKKNFGLNLATKRARELGVTKTIQRQIIQKCKFICEGGPIAILQIRYQRKAFIICTVFTRHLQEFVQSLIPLFKKHFAGIAHVLHMFRNYTFVEAVVPPQFCGDFEDLDHNVRIEASECGAISSDLQDHETGTFRFRVDPLKIHDVGQALKSRGYYVNNVEYNFQPKTLVNLTHHEREAYDNFIWKLRQVPEINEIYDNVRNSAASKLF